MRAKDSREELRRAQAKEDFIALGLNGSVDMLWKRYVLDAQSGIDVPTRNRTTIYNWKKWDYWEDARAARLGQQIDDQKKAVEDYRKLGIQRLGLLTEKAIETVSKMMDGGDKVALQAATEVLDRVGIVKFDNKSVKQKDDEGGPTAPAPSIDASDEELLNYLAEKRRKV